MKITHYEVLAKKAGTYYVCINVGGGRWICGQCRRGRADKRRKDWEAPKFKKRCEVCRAEFRVGVDTFDPRTSARRRAQLA